MEKVKAFFQTKLGRHVHSFGKTYVTVFIGTYLALNGLLDEVNALSNIQGLQELNLADVSTLLISAKFAFLSVIRNLYKLLMD